MPISTLRQHDHDMLVCLVFANQPPRISPVNDDSGGRACPYTHPIVPIACDWSPISPYNLTTSHRLQNRPLSSPFSSTIHHNITRMIICIQMAKWQSLQQPSTLLLLLLHKPPPHYHHYIPTSIPSRSQAGFSSPRIIVSPCKA